MLSLMIHKNNFEETLLTDLLATEFKNKKPKPHQPQEHRRDRWGLGKSNIAKGKNDRLSLIQIQIMLHKGW